MKPGWLLPSSLAVVLAASAAATVASRLWLLESLRELRHTEVQLQSLLREEEALQVEWVVRTDLNTVERRAREELGMVRPSPQQWHPVTP